MKTKIECVVVHHPTIKEQLSNLYDKITLRKFYREKFKSEFRNLYNARISNLLDYLDEDKATIIVSQRVSEKEFSLNRSKLLICGEYIVFNNNFVRTNGHSGVSVEDSRAITLSNNVVDATVE